MFSLILSMLFLAYLTLPHREGTLVIEIHDVRSSKDLQDVLKLVERCDGYRPDIRFRILIIPEGFRDIPREIPSNIEIVQHGFDHVHPESLAEIERGRRILRARSYCPPGWDLEPLQRKRIEAEFDEVLYFTHVYENGLNRFSPAIDASIANRIIVELAERILGEARIVIHWRRKKDLEKLGKILGDARLSH